MDGYPDLQSVLRRMMELEEKIAGIRALEVERQSLESLALSEMREGRVYNVKSAFWQHDPDVAFYRLAGVLHRAVAEMAMSVTLPALGPIVADAATGSEEGEAA